MILQCVMCHNLKIKERKYRELPEVTGVEFKADLRAQEFQLIIPKGVIILLRLLKRCSSSVGACTFLECPEQVKLQLFMK